MKINYITIICFFLQGCRGGVGTVSITPPEKPVYVEVGDTAFKFYADTLYYKSARFNGYAYSMYNEKDTAFIGHYKDGLEEGVFKKWYHNHQLAEYRVYTMGKKTGHHVGYWEHGGKQFEFNFKEGEHDGAAMEWYKNGQLYKQFHYHVGYEEGAQKMWWENGTIRANYVVKNGRRYGLIGLKLCANPLNKMIKKKNE